MRLRTAALAGLIAALLPAPALADTLFDNLQGISVSRDGAIDRFSAMVVDEEGRIIELLDFGDRPTGEIEYRTDMEDRVVIPGFVDAHVNLMDLGLSTMVLDLSPSKSLDEALSRIAAYAAAYPDRPWIIGRGWDQDKWGLGRFPSAAELDEVVSDRPVWLEHRDGGAGWANSTALAAANITAETRDPDGGRIIRRQGSRLPAGVLAGNAMKLVDQAVPAPLPDDRSQALYAAQNLLFSRGVTAVADMGTTTQDWMDFRRAGDEGWLRLRIMAYAASVPEMLLIGGAGPTRWLYEDRLRMGGVSLMRDGGLGSRGAMLKAGYIEEPGNRGLSLTSGTQIRNLMSRAALGNFQVAIQATGDAAVEDALFAIDELAADYTGDRRWRIEQAQSVDPADSDRFNAHGIIASVQLASQTAYPGLDDPQTALAWRLIYGAGGTLAFGSGAPDMPPAPLASIALAISGNNEAGDAAGSRAAQQPMPRETALAGHTAIPAYAGFADGIFGRLATGERADFLVLSADPLTGESPNVAHISVLETWIAGQMVYARK